MRNTRLGKPVDLAEFFEAVRVLGKYWAVVNEPPALGIHKGAGNAIHDAVRA